MVLRHDWHFAWLLIASFVAGALNAMAGGGSFLSFPAVLGMGVLPIQANATNTVAIWPGQLTSIAGYMSDLRANLKLVVPICSAAFAGGLGGAILLLHTGQKTFMAMVPWLLLFATALFAASAPISRWVQRTLAERPGRVPALAPLWIVVAAVCIYIGFFGAGAGFLLMSALAIFGIDNIHQVNALKTVATTTANGIAVVAFIVAKQVFWVYCLPMMVTAAIGGFAGARFSRRLNPGFMRALVVVIGSVMAGYFFWKQ
jgi:uncharacterized protein